MHWLQTETTYYAKERTMENIQTRLHVSSNLVLMNHLLFVSLENLLMLNHCFQKTFNNLRLGNIGISRLQSIPVRL